MIYTSAHLYSRAIIGVLLTSALFKVHADIEKIQPEFSGENQSAEVDKLFEKGLFPKKDANVSLAVESSYLKEKSLEMSLEKPSIADFLDRKMGAEKGIEKAAKEANPAIDAAYIEEDFFPGESDQEVESQDFIDLPQNVPVQYPDFKGPIVKESVAPVDLKKQTMGCSDVLMGSQVFNDPTVGLAFTYVYTLCLMELAVQKYLQSAPYLQQEAKGLMGAGQKTLQQLQAILPSYLLGLKALEDGFRDGHLRKVLDEARQNYQEKQSGIGL